MHGDMSQAQRENVIRRLRSGDLEVVVATDVAARGLDVERIGLVVNYDVPYDSESYVHRIGRTGAPGGGQGAAVCHPAPETPAARYRALHRAAHRADQNAHPGRRCRPAGMALFKERILNTLEGEDLDLYLNLVQELAIESGRDMAEIAAAAARLARGDKPLEVVIEPLPRRPPAPKTAWCAC
jgi:ATP-dependent RNA helicase DeaD